MHHEVTFPVHVWIVQFVCSDTDSKEYGIGEPSEGCGREGVLVSGRGDS